MGGRSRKPTRRYLVEKYDEFERYVSNIGLLNLLIVIGDGGTGKTEAAKAAVGTDACYLTGRMTAFALYQKLYENRDRVILLDDIDDLFRDPLAVAILKAACGSQPVRTVQWNSAARQLAGAGVPTEFATRSRFVVIANCWEEVSKNVEAFNTRGHLIEFRPTALEVHLKAATFLTAEYQDVFDYLADRLHLIETPSFRHYIRARESQKAGNLDWKRELAAHAFLQGPRLVVAELEKDPTFPTVEQKVEEFARRTGLSRATYFNHKNKLPPAVTAPKIVLPPAPLPETKPATGDLWSRIRRLGNPEWN
jgi:hypothetical protein